MFNGDLEFKNLQEITNSDAKRFGAKAVNLGSLSRLGLNVPQAICFSLPAAARLSPSQFTNMLQLVHEAFRENTFPVAVRSSFPGEDGDVYSYAGQFLTVLNVNSASELELAFSKCLDSVASESAEAYRTRHGLKLPSHLGIIVQQMIQADFAGICFTVDVRNEEKLTIEYVKGLGDSLVSGHVTPKKIIFEKANEDLAQENISQLVRETRKISDHYGSALDIEWAIKNKEIFILQARPTTHQSAQAQLEQLRNEEILRLRHIAEKETQVWADFSIGDVLPYPSTLVIDSFHRASFNGEGMAQAWTKLGFGYNKNPDGPKLFENICGSTYINLTEYLKTVNFGVSLKAKVKNSKEIKITLDFKLSALCRLITLPYRVVKIFKSFFKVRRDFLKRFESEIYIPRRLEAKRERETELSHLSDTELWNRYEDLSSKSRSTLASQHLLSDIIAGVTQGLVRVGLGFLYGAKTPEIEMTLFTGLPGNFNTDTNLALFDLATQTISEDVFLEEFGHRGHPDWDPAAPRWREDQSSLNSLKTSLLALTVSPESSSKSKL